MPAVVPLWQEVSEQIQTLTRRARVRVSSAHRLALLVTGIVAAESVVVARVADEVLALGLTGASTADSIARRIRRTLNDRRLEATTCYQPVLAQVLDWETLLAGGRTVTLVVDESSQDDRIHLLRLSVAYWGGALPLAWAVWEQNQPLPEGMYWQMMDAVLAQVAALLPAGVAVVVTADRAFDIPPFVDRITAHGWHGVVRAKARSGLRFRDRRGREQPLAVVVAQHVSRPGQRWKGRGWVFKDAGWRAASVVAVWAAGEAEPVVLLTDLPPRWERLAEYDRRFWIEPGFRNDKTAGWRWEDSQVQGVGHHERLLLAMAWASLVVLCLGVQAAHERLVRLAHRRPRRYRGRWRVGRPQHARQSIFTLGLRRARQWLYRPLTVACSWCLPELDAPSWAARWYHAQACRFIFQSVRP